MSLVRKGGMIVLIVYTFVITSLRTLRSPNDFAEAHWLLDYRFGFIKRGLILMLLLWGNRMSAAHRFSIQGCSLFDGKRRNNCLTGMRTTFLLTQSQEIQPVHRPHTRRAGRSSGNDDPFAEGSCPALRLADPLPLTAGAQDRGAGD